MLLLLLVEAAGQAVSLRRQGRGRGALLGHADAVGSSGGQHGLVVLAPGDGGQLLGDLGDRVQVPGPQRNLHLTDPIVLGEGVLVIHLEHQGLLPRHFR